MTTTAQMLVNGAALASVYALIALGFTVVFQTAGTMNFAQASLMTLAGLVVVELHDPLGFWPALLVGALAAAAMSMVEALLMRAARQRDMATLAIMAIGFNILLLAELSRRMGTDVYTLGDPWGSDVVEVAGVTVATSRIASIVTSTVLIALFFGAFQHTPWGLAMRASAIDPEAAALMGIRRRRLELSGWAVSGALAAVAVVFLASFPSQGLDQSTGSVALAAFPAAIIGGLGKPAGALLGSAAIGLTEAATATYQSSLAIFGSGLPLIAPYVVMVVVLLLRPQGLLGAKEIARV